MVDALIVTLGVAFFFSFWNGFTDAANAIATIVGTKVLSPFKAVGLSAIGNLSGMFFGSAVAVTIGAGIVRIGITTELLLAALIGGLMWDLSTYWLALPISESHVLIGGLVGAGLAAGGAEAVNLNGVVNKVLIPMAGSPIIALVVGFFFTVGIIRLFRTWSWTRVNKTFGRLQLVSSIFFSITHGSNDGQKTVGIVTALLVTYGYIQGFEAPLWVILASFGAISFGTLLGGWRIVHTMGMRITKLVPYQGFCAETSAAMVLASTAYLGFPVSTTHAISGSIMGVGSTRRFSAVRWGVTRRIIWAWVLTIPATATSAYLVYNLIGLVI